MTAIGRRFLMTMVTAGSLCFGQTPKLSDLDQKLFDSMSTGSSAASGELLKNGAHANARNSAGETPLILVVTIRNTGLIEMMRVLIDGGTDVNLRSNDGSSALTRAAAQHKLEAVRLLVAKGADVNGATTKGDTALILAIGGAAYVPHDISDKGLIALEDITVKITSLLLERGADPRAKNARGETPLSLAAEFDRRLGRHKVLALLEAAKPPAKRPAK